MEHVCVLFHDVLVNGHLLYSVILLEYLSYQRDVALVLDSNGLLEQLLDVSAVQRIPKVL